MRTPTLLAVALALACATTSSGPRRLANTKGATACAGLASTDSAVYDTTQVTERPRTRSIPVLHYPVVAQRRHEGGLVMIAMIIEPDGSVQQGSLRIVQSTDTVFDAEALRWARGASYWPACRDGRPVRIADTKSIEFWPSR